MSKTSKKFTSKDGTKKPAKAPTSTYVTGTAKSRTQSALTPKKTK